MKFAIVILAACIVQILNRHKRKTHFLRNRVSGGFEDGELFGKCTYKTFRIGSECGVGFLCDTKYFKDGSYHNYDKDDSSIGKCKIDPEDP